MGQAIYPGGSSSSCSLCPMGKNVPGLTLLLLLLLPCSLLTPVLHPDTHTKGKSCCWESVGCFLGKQACEDVDLESELQQPDMSCWQCVYFSVYQGICMCPADHIVNLRVTHDPVIPSTALGQCSCLTCHTHPTPLHSMENVYPCQARRLVTVAFIFRHVQPEAQGPHDAQDSYE